MRTLQRLAAFIVIFLLAGIGFANGQAPDFELTKREITVYRDGVVLVVEEFRVNQSLAQAAVDLLSAGASSILVVDQAKAPLAFDVAGQSITIHTLGATGARLEYQTSDLTKKEGAVWTLKFNTQSRANLTLPEQATITFLNAIPEVISVSGARPMLILGTGAWEISYTLPVVVAQTPQAPQQGQPPAQNPQQPAGQLPDNQLSMILVPVVAATAGAGAFLIYRNRRSSSIDMDVRLRPEEEQLLKFLAENNRKALESELRKKFVLPKTSMWRMAKRLERMGYVKINRIGFQNEIELIKKP